MNTGKSACEVCSGGFTKTGGLAAWDVAACTGKPNISVNISVAYMRSVIILLLLLLPQP